VEAGRHWLPGTATGCRETLVTSRLHGVPQYLLVLPGDSWLPLLAAVGTAGYFLLMTVHFVAAAWLFGLGAVGAILAWLWQRHAGADTPSMMRVGSRLVLPVGASGRASHSWWAVMVVVVVDVSIFLSLAFAFIHAAMRLTVCPPPGAHLPAGVLLAAGCALMAASSVLMAWPRTSAPAGSRLLVLRVLAAAACMFAGAAVVACAYWMAGLSPREDAWNAGIAVLIAYNVLHAIALTPGAAYVAARLAADKPWRAEWENTALFWHGAVLQGIAGALLPLAV